jgi:hypothetical protein
LPMGPSPRHIGSHPAPRCTRMGLCKLSSLRAAW